MGNSGLKPKPKTYCEVLKDARKFGSKRDWSLVDQYNFRRAKAQGWLPQITSDCFDVWDPNPPPITTERILACARKSKTLREMAEKFPLEYVRAQGGANRKVVRENLQSKPFKAQEWTESAIIRNAVYYATWLSWIKAEPGAVKAAESLFLLEKIYQKLFKPSRRTMMTPDTVDQEARKYRTAGEWREKCLYTYSWTYRKKLLQRLDSEIFSRLRNMLTREECIASEMRYKSVREWMENDRIAYENSCRNGWRVRYPKYPSWYSFFQEEPWFFSIALVEKRYQQAKRMGLPTPTGRRGIRNISFADWSTEQLSECQASYCVHEPIGSHIVNFRSAAGLTAKDSKRGWRTYRRSNLFKSRLKAFIKNPDKEKSRSLISDLGKQGLKIAHIYPILIDDVGVVFQLLDYDSQRRAIQLLSDVGYDLLSCASLCRAAENNIQLGRIFTEILGAQPETEF